MAGRARAALAAKNNAQLEDHTWKRYADCEYCGRTIMVNNYDDRKSRTPRFLGLVICPWCEPRHVDDRWLWRMDTKGEKPRISNPTIYRMVISTWLARMLVRGVNPDKVRAQAAKFWDEGGVPRPLAKPNTDPTMKSSDEIYGRG